MSTVRRRWFERLMLLSVKVVLCVKLYIHPPLVCKCKPHVVWLWSWSTLWTVRRRGKDERRQRPEKAQEGKSASGFKLNHFCSGSKTNNFYFIYLILHFILIIFHFAFYFILAIFQSNTIDTDTRLHDFIALGLQVLFMYQGNAHLSELANELIFICSPWAGNDK